MENHEQKYKKAIEIARNIYSAWESKDISTLTTIFSDLKKNEDEKIVDELKGILAATIMPKPTKREIFNWLGKQENSNTFDVPETSIEDAEEVTSRMQYINDDMKPIADFVMGYAKWNLHKDEWNQPTLTVPLFRVLDALILSGKPYGCIKIEESDEQKPVDKIEPKFHEGDWITNGLCIFKIASIEDGFYYDTNNCGSDIESIDKEYHLWTIQDAKDGDVLMTVTPRNCPFIYRETDCNKHLAYYYAGVDGNGNFCEGCLKRRLYHFGPVANITPATKEQRDLLFREMKEAGYVWDGDKKELKKIPTDSCVQIEKISEQIHSNPEKVGMNEESKWTDEDEETMQHCCGAIAAADYYTMENKEEMEKWLISLKQRIEAKEKMPFDHDNVNIQQKDFVPKVEPKFKVGDWVVFITSKSVYNVEKIENYEYTLRHIFGGSLCLSFSNEKLIREWTIQDAKDGDVLATPNYIYIFNSIVQETETVCFYCLMKISDEHFSFGDYRIHDEILNSIPATKEQRDLLFQKMKEAGYEWDAEKKEVATI